MLPIKNPKRLSKNILSIFEKNPTNDIKKKINYVVDNTKITKRIEDAQKNQEQNNLIRRNTVASFNRPIMSNNVRRMSEQIVNIEKAEKERQEQLLKDIHQKKEVDNSTILERAKRMNEKKQKEKSDKIKYENEYEDNINGINYDINSEISNANSEPSNSISKFNYDSKKAFENIIKNEKLKTQIEHNLNKIFGEDLDKKNLTFEQKYHLFDRKINNYEDSEKLQLNIKIKNPKSEYEYKSKIYNEENKLIAQSDKQKGEKEIILYNNLVVDYIFSKKTNYTYEIIKALSDLEEIKSEMNISLNNILSTEENQNYEKKIEEFNDNEVINIGFDSKDNTNIDDKQKEEEKDIQLFFFTKNEEELSSVISYSIQKDNKIIYKSPICSTSHIKQTDKIPLSILNPEFEISFYNKNYEEQKITILMKELLNLKTKNVIIDLPEIEKLEIAISIEKFDKISLIKLKKKGLNIDLSIAIDFTSSNGYPTRTDSLHYIKYGNINNYEKSIRACLDILSIYNKKDEYDVYGFGADINGILSNCFNISGTEDSKIKGVENIIKDYKNTVNKVVFSGGTYLAPIINIINDKISSNKNNMNYNVLLIISDGHADDIDEIVDSIIKSSKLPLSIIIIGVGDDVSSDMKRLNGESGKLINSKGECLEKDIVQYVHFNDYNENIEKLTQEVFRYIPHQIKDYFQNKGETL